MTPWRQEIQDRLEAVEESTDINKSIVHGLFWLGIFGLGLVLFLPTAATWIIGALLVLFALKSIVRVTKSILQVRRDHAIIRDMTEAMGLPVVEPYRDSSP